MLTPECLWVCFLADAYSSFREGDEQGGRCGTSKELGVTKCLMEGCYKFVVLGNSGFSMRIEKVLGISESSK